jgi:hypothetical protein
MIVVTCRPADIRFALLFYLISVSMLLSCTKMAPTEATYVYAGVRVSNLPNEISKVAAVMLVCTVIPPNCYIFLHIEHFSYE